MDAVTRYTCGLGALSEKCIYFRECFWRASKRMYNATMPQPAGSLHTFRAGEAHVEIYGSSAAAGNAAAEKAAQAIRSAIANHGRARVIGATGNSQIPLVDALTKQMCLSSKPRCAAMPSS